MEAISSPLFRVTTFGHFTLYHQCAPVQSSEEPPSYEPIVEKVWRSRTASCSVLKLLLCRTRRRAPRDVLIEALWPDVPVSNANHNFDTAVSFLRTLLRLDGRESLLTTIHSSSTTIYELPPQSLLWVDSDEFLAQVELSEQAEERGADPLPHLEAAWQIGKHIFLEDELYCEWAQSKRQTINITRHRILHRLADSYLQRNRHNQAETLLLKVLEEEPTDEDSVYRLMRVFEQQGRRQEALRCYERLVAVLKEESEAEPLPSTQALAERLRTSVHPTAIVHTPFPSDLGTDMHMHAKSHGLSGPQLATAPTPCLRRRGYALPILFCNGEERSEIESETCPSVLVKSQKELSCDLFYCIIKEVLYWTGQEDFQARLQMVIDRLIKEFDTMEPPQNPAQNLLSRRDALMMIAGLPLSLLVKIQTGPVTSSMLEEFLAQCTASLATCTHLLKGADYRQVGSILARYLPELEKLAYQPWKQQESAASLAAQGHFLAGLLALHQNDLLKREAHCKQAIELSRITKDVNLHVSALQWLAVTYYYAKQPLKALHAYQEIEPLIDHISPLLQGSVYVKMAGVYAQCNREQDALRFIGMAQDVFPEHPEYDLTFHYTDNGLFTMPIWEGFAYLDLGQPTHAWSALERIEKLSTITVVPDRVRVEALAHKAEAALALGDQELFRTYIEMSVNGAKALGSERRYSETLDIYRQARRMWQNESRVKELQDLFVR